MPRPTGLTRPQIGSGRASPGTVDVSAWSNPDQGTDGLRTHVQDPSRAHMASSTGIVDAGGYYLSDEVEGALQEIGGASSGGRQNGVVTGFGYTAVGLTVTFDTPSTALIPTLRTYAGESVTLPDNTPSVWVYISPATGLITQFLGANPPSISTPENVLLWQFATLAGAVTSARDARLYVRNLDRKLPFTVRSVGSQADQESEACFVTLDAALTYLQYSSVLGSNRSEVVIRGPVTTGPVNVPVSGVHFRGEDGASITLTSGTYLFDMQGRDDVTFSDIAFKTDVVNATAVTDSVGTSEFLSFTRCNVTGGTTDWEVGFYLTMSTGRLTVSNCRIAAYNVGMRVFAPAGLLIDQAEVVTSNFLAASEGIRVGVFPTSVTEVPSTVRGCTVTGFDTGIRVSGIGHTVTGCSVVPGANGAYGIRIDTSQDVVLSGNRIDCSVNNGATGISATGTAAAKVTGLKVIDNTVYGATTYGINLRGFVQESLVRGNLVDCNRTSALNDPTADAGIYVQSFGGVTDVPAYNVVSGNTVWRAKTGIYLAGTSASPVVETVVSGNTVHHCAGGVVAPPTLFWQTSTGIGAEWCVGLNVSGNNVYGIGRILTDAGTVVDPTPADVYSTGITLSGCTQVSTNGNRVRDLFVKGAGKASGINASYIGAVATVPEGMSFVNNSIASIPGNGIVVPVNLGGSLQPTVLRGARIAGNSINDTATGITVYAHGRATVSDLRVEGNTVENTTVGSGIEVLALAASVGTPHGVVTGAQVVDNTVTTSAGKGISIECQDGASVSQVSVDRNAVRLTAGFGIDVVGGTAGGTGAALLNTVSMSGNDIDMNGVVTRALSWVSYAATSVTNIDVSDNTVVNSSTGFEYSMAGPGGTDTVVSDFHIRRNTITASNRGVYGYVTGFINRHSVSENGILAELLVFSLWAQPTAPVTTTSNGVSLSRNRFRSVPAGINVRLRFVNHKVFDLRVEDNAFTGGSIAAGGALLVDVQGAGTGAVPAMRNFVVRRNAFRDVACSGVMVVVADPADPVVDTVISDNSFESVATDVGVARASVIWCTFNAEVRNLAVRNNQFASTGHSSATHGGIDLTVKAGQGLDVSGNQFDVSGTSVYGNIVNLGPTALGVSHLRDVSVCKNKARGVVVPAGATTPSYVALDVRTFTEVTNLSVCDNDIDRIDNGPGNTVGIRVWADAPVYRLACERNRVSGASVGASALSVSLDNGVNDASVCNNHVAGDTVSGAGGNGISVYVGATSVAVRVSDNTVRGEDGTPGSGLLVQTAATGAALNGSYVERNYVRGYDRNLSVYSGSCTNLSVSGNDSVGHSITGVEVLCTGIGGVAANLTVDGNKVSTTTATQSQFVRVEATDSNYYENLSVCGNDMRYTQANALDPDIAAGYGIYIATGSSGTTKIDNGHVCRNRAQTITSALDIHTGGVRGVHVDDNEAVDVLSGIAHLFSPPVGGVANVHGYSVSRNTVVARDTSGASGLIYLHLSNDTNLSLFQLCHIDGNNVGCVISAGGTGADTGICIGTLLDVAAARSVSVSGNTVRSCKNGITAFFASAEALSMDNNKVSQVTNGVSLVSSIGSHVGDTFDVSFSHNSVTTWNVGGAASAAAYTVFFGNSASNYARDLALIGNSCYTNLNDTIGWEVTVLTNNSNGMVFANNTVSFLIGTTNTTSLKMAIGGAGGSGGVSNYAFSSNVFRRATQGIVYSTTGYNPSKSTFMGNIGTTGAPSWSQFENAGAAGWTNVLPPAGAGAGQFQTLNIDNGT